jgi:hypothetical protein
MESKKYLYAAVGAPVATAKRAQARLEETRSKLDSGRKTLTSDLQKQLDEWATEGEGFVTKLGDSKAIDELNGRVDLDGMQEQVSKLRDQLEDLLETWRSNFRPAGKPAKITEKVEVEVAAAKPAAKTTASKTGASKTGVSKTTAAKKPASKAAAKKPAAKTAAKKPAAKTAAKAS